MAVNNISYSIYQLSTRTENGYIIKMIPFFFCSVYMYINFDVYVTCTHDLCVGFNLDVSEVKIASFFLDLDLSYVNKMNVFDWFC